MPVGSGGGKRQARSNATRSADVRLKHLEFVEGVIARLANNGFVIKGWAVTVAGVFFGFAVESGEPFLALASLTTTMLFWGLDAYFLYAERRFRDLYERVRVDDAALPELSMHPEAGQPSTKHRDSVGSWVKSATRPAVSWLYVGLVASAGVVFLLSAALPNRDGAVSAPSPSVAAQTAPPVPTAQPSTPASTPSAHPTSPPPAPTAS